jgi:putative transposase
MFERKPNRLDLSFYRGIRAYFVTICTKEQQQVFSGTETVEEHLKILSRCCEKEKFSVWAYCFMPDHLHLLLTAKENSDLIKLVTAYKRLSGYEYKKTTGKNLWQKSFYDHILRKEENIAELVRYVLENPVRKNIVEDFREYPFSGSLEFGKDIFNM